MNLDAGATGGVGRMAGIDLARALAIIGMVTVHISPSGTDSSLAYVLALPRGRSAILFALLAGVGVSLLAASRTTSTGQARRTLLWRVVVLLPLGLWLQTLDHNVLVILADYAVLFLVAIVLLTWSDRWLLMVAAGSAVLGGIGFRAGQLYVDDFERAAPEFGQPVLEIVQALVVSGPYPLITWLAPLCVGMWLGRRDLRAAVVRRRLLQIGGAVGVLIPAVLVALDRLAGVPVPSSGWWPLLDDTPHSQRPLWLLSTIAAAAAILGLCLWLASVWPGPVRFLARSGQLAFTWYVAHLLVLHVNEDLLRTGSIAGTFTVIAIFAAVMAVVSALWLAAVPRGPLEFVLRPPRRRTSSGTADDQRGVGDSPRSCS